MMRDSAAEETLQLDRRAKSGSSAAREDDCVEAPLKVLLVANTLPPTDISGVGEQVLQLASGLRDRGHDVRVLGRGKGGASGPKLFFPLAIVLPFVRVLRRFRPDVVQVHESDGALAAACYRLVHRWLAPGSVLISLLQVSYVEEIRAVRPLRFRGKLLGAPGAVERRFRRFKAPLHVLLGRLSARVSDLVMTPSHQTSSEIETDYRVTRTAVLPNVTGGLEVTPDRSANSAAHSAGSSAGHSGDRLPVLPFFLFVGRLRIRKGVEVLLHALVALNERSVEDAARRPRLAVAGAGEHQPFLERLTSELGLEDQVEFLGRQSSGRVRQLLAATRALVVPSIYEGMPLVILEAMESGTAVIASRVSGIPEVVIDGETGWVVEAEDVDGLAEALQAAWEDEQQAVDRGLAGKLRLDREFRPRNAVEIWCREVEGLRRKIG